MGGKIIKPHQRDNLVVTIALLETALRKADEIGLPDMAVKICHAMDIGREALGSDQNERN